MAQLYKSQTIAQFKIMLWLEAQGVTQEDVAAVELLAADRVKVTNPAGQCTTLAYRDGEVWIERDRG